MKNRDILLELLQDAEDFAKLKGIECPPIYFLGGSGCIMGGYFDRATTDIDFLDINYSSSVGKIFRLFEKFDMLDLYVTSIADGFEKRAIKLSEFEFLDFFVLSKEDIIVSKLGRYSDKDIEDISKLIVDIDKEILSQLIDNVIDKKHFSERVKKYFIIHAKNLKERFNV